MHRASKNIFIIATIAAVGIPVHSFASLGHWLWVIINILCGILLVFGQKYQLKWTASVGFIFIIIMAISCVFLKIPPERLLACVVATLVMWDLHRFIYRLRQVDTVEKADVLEQRHLKTLALIAGTGLLLGVIVLKANLYIRFGWMLFLGIALIIGIVKFIEQMSREGD